MALGNPADIGYGATIAIVSGYQITDMSVDGFGERSVVDISSSVSTNAYRIFLPGDLKDGGSATVEFNLLTNALAAYKTLIAASKASSALTFPIPTDGGTGAGTLTVVSFCSGLSMALPIDDRMVGTANVKFAAEPSMVDAT
jgi:hypothetical protein